MPRTLTSLGHDHPAPHRHKYDVVVFGNGPAGAAAAVALARKGFTVAVVAKAQSDRPKVGETVSPTIMRSLCQLGIWDRFVAAGHAQAPGTSVIWGGARPYENEFILNPYGPGWHLDRTHFDSMLIDAASAAGADIYDASATDDLRADRGGWTVHLAHAPVGSLKANWVLDATGRSAWLARRQGAKRCRVDRLVSLVGFATTASAREPRTLLESCSAGWWYAAVLPAGRIVAAFFTDADLLPRSQLQRDQLWNETLARTQLISSVMPTSAASPILVVAACTGHLLPCGGRNWLAIGDAAQSWDPLSGQGIEKALTSAIGAAEAISAVRSGNADALCAMAGAAEMEFRKYRQIQATHYGRESRWPDQIFWQRRQLSLHSA
jgi:flavin-dependent dehydrogenase